MAIIERSNQRGGRMFSVVDLIEAGTLTVAQVAWLSARIDGGASWLVGAQPGGAGKTTVMSALLGLLPADVNVRLANPGTDWQNAQPGECVVAYEISPGSYDAYVWGEDVRRLAELAASGVRVVTNLHADTLDQARQQIVHENGASETQFMAFDLFLPIRLELALGRDRNRRIHKVRWSDQGAWCTVAREEMEHVDLDADTVAFLEDCQEQGIRRANEFRNAWLAFRNSSSFPKP